MLASDAAEGPTTRQRVPRNCLLTSLLRVADSLKMAGQFRGKSRACFAPDGDDRKKPLSDDTTSSPESSQRPSS